MDASWYTSTLDLIQTDLDQSNQIISQRLKSDVPLINALSEHIIDSGGKRIRPILVLLISHALNHCESKSHLLAAIIELIHTATLLHDDVIDTSELRRGQPTANSIWGNTASVLTGDYLYSRAFEMMVELGELNILEKLAAASNQMATGELIQHANANNPEISKADYLKTIEFKTAKLFETACEIPAILASASQSIQKNLARFGTLLGMAFQITDDILDYTTSSGTLGKNCGDDLADGKVTLPIIHTLSGLDKNSSDYHLIIQSIQTGSLEYLDHIKNLIHQTQSIEKSKQDAQSIVNEALDCLSILPQSKYTDALKSTILYTVNRIF